MTFLNTIRLTALINILLFTANALFAQNNPVIDNVPDVGVINFNGKYYLAGVNTNGGFYISDDLVHWKGPEHVFTMANDWTKGKPFGDNQIHAADIRYINGRFHFYWSVNYWGGQNTTVQIGHAVADNIMGPYIEPDKKNWFDERIDPHLLVDSDSSLYFYTVKFTDGNTIWGQQMRDPWTHRGSPKLLFNSLPLTWERMDNSVTEGPEVIKYRSRYYLMYNANHTGNTYGNYALGVAEADEPLGFNSANKYPHPVVQQNLTDDPSKQRRVFSSSLDGFTNWKYTFNQPGESWNTPAFTDTEWKKGDKGFGNQVLKGSTRINPQTMWRTNDIWVRKHFKIPWALSGQLQLMVNHTGPTEVFMDGQLIYNGVAANYTTVNLLPQLVNELKTGEHVLVIHGEKAERGANIDVDLIENLASPGDDILYNPGQPNLLKGPNGFEWWLVYFAIKNGGKKGQFINRVLFNDHELTVDGPTSNKTTGYHPDPALPIFGDSFEDENIKDRWSLQSGKWRVRNGELMQEGNTGKSLALIKSRASSNYLFKIGVNPTTLKTANAGIIAYYTDALNFLEIGIDQAKGAWYSRLVRDGKEIIVINKLSPVFNFNVYHSLSVYKNGNTVEFQIDDQPAPGKHQIITLFDEPGLPGIFTQATTATFDGAIYTPGWDEYNAGITGWGNAVNRKQATGEWGVTEKGITINKTQGESTVYKGDLLNSYEFATQIYSNGAGTAGIFPVYTDENNYVKAAIDFQHNSLIVSGKLNGAAIPGKTILLKRKMVRYPDQRYSDHSNKVYTLKANTSISNIEIVKFPVDNKQLLTINLFDSLKVEYHHHDEWRPLNFEKIPTGIQAVDQIKFPLITADALRIRSSGFNTRMPAVYKIYTDEDGTSDYNLRAVKLKDKLLLFLDNGLIADIDGTWPPSQVGLFGTDAGACFNGLMLFEKRDN
ncbi:family 43 glycosylhydrolase [Mucilaginibacter mali]|uniref:Family 43 glycosylhydrolase n=1 Tax=Mucilaginibacter mali TaxID=2740462 RepID=A0A7D4UJ55_9SPHI|nr:family 43 glycosylhydrolase [Mucilaginibacter mali]QKJ28562.1 family 43 glycosylhydrolase [Mucilaginibacter mali]